MFGAVEKHSKTIKLFHSIPICGWKQRGGRKVWKILGFPVFKIREMPNVCTSKYYVLGFPVVEINREILYDLKMLIMEEGNAKQSNEKPKTNNNEHNAEIAVQNTEEKTTQNLLDYEPKISVIIPVYNVEKYLCQCLDSVINQTFKEIEIICVNDGSTDNSGKILYEYAGKDKRIRVINQENKGLSAARNSGLKVSTANYISFIDSDDFVHPQFLEILYNAIEMNKCDISGCNFAKISNNTQKPEISSLQSKTYKPALDVLLDKKNFIHFNVWNKLYKREAIRNINFVEGIYYEDWVFNTCVFAQIKSFAWVNSPLYGYRISNNSIMRSSYNMKKLNDYITGIYEVYNFISKNYPLQWLKIKQTRIARTIKMMMNSALRSKNSKIIKETGQALKNLNKEQIIGYRGLSLQNKIKLFKFLH